MSNICFLLSCLLVPLSFGLIDLQSTLPLNGAVHILLEILIVLAIFWLIWLLNRFDRWLYLRSSLSQKKNTLSQKRIVETNIFIMEANINPHCTGNQKETAEVEKRLSNSSSTLAVNETLTTTGKLTLKNGQ